MGPKQFYVWIRSKEPNRKISKRSSRFIFYVFTEEFEIKLYESIKLIFDSIKEVDIYSHVVMEIPFQMLPPELVVNETRISITLGCNSSCLLKWLQFWGIV